MKNQGISTVAPVVLRASSARCASACSRQITSGPPMWSRRTARAMVNPPWISSVEALLQPALRRCCIEFVDERDRLRPFAETGCGIEVADFAEVDQLAAPRPGKRGDAFVACEWVVAAGSADAGERQRVA